MQVPRTFSFSFSFSFLILFIFFHFLNIGYALSRWCLTPYRGVRYHLNEWAQGNRRPLNARELFNLRHSQLRNVIERVFGILKKRFPILNLMSSYSMEKQVAIVKSCFMAHNFIKAYQDYEDVYDQWDENEDANNVNDVEEEEVYGLAAATWRDSIAEAMWVQYQEYLQANP
jgi:hypothetical protein